MPLSTQGTDAGKKIVGRERGIITDTLGLLLAVVVTAASVSDNTIDVNLLDQAATRHPDLAKSWVDAGFKKTVDEHGQPFVSSRWGSILVRTPIQLSRIRCRKHLSIELIATLRGLQESLLQRPGKARARLRESYVSRTDASRQSDLDYLKEPRLGLWMMTLRFCG